jgi:hypothetical protein
MKKNVTLLLLSGGKDSHEALRLLIESNHQVYCLCIDGIQGKERPGAEEAAKKMNAELEVRHLSFFDEETWNPAKLVMRDLAMGYFAIRKAKAVGATNLACGVKRADLLDPDLWWLPPFLSFGKTILKLFGINLLFPVWENEASDKSHEKIKKESTFKTMQKKSFYFLASCLPQFIRYPFYRHKFAKVPATISAGLTFELAKTQEELEDAFKLLHDAYVEQGFITPQPSGMRLILQHALPTTAILVAKVGGKVVGTVSVMRNTSLGLPMEKAFDISHLTKKGCRVAEISCLAIHKDFRRKMGGDIFFPLTLFSAAFAKNYFGTDYLVFNLYPQHADFYNAIFGSTYLNGIPNISKEYLGAPASGIQLDLQDVIRFGKKYYSGLGIERDLYAYTFETKHSHFLFPPVENGMINYPVFTPALFRYFFDKKTNLLQNISEIEEQVLARYYPFDSYAKVIPISRKKDLRNPAYERWDTRLTGECLDLMSNIKILLLDMSYNGFRAHLSSGISLKENRSFEFSLPDKTIVKVKATAMWNSGDNVYGFQVVEASKEWNDLVEVQSNGLNKIAA